MKITIVTFLFSFFLTAVLFPQPKTPDWASTATIYEVNIRQYTPEGTFAAFQKHVPRLKELGVDILWLMPINPIGELNRKGKLGSYYSVKDYKEINPEFGNKNDFKNLVDEVHKQGMYLIVDWVANHTAWDHPWVKEHPDFYTKDSLGNFIPPVADWADVIDLNFDNKEMRNEMTSAMKYWVKEFNIDGYRCDVAGMIPTEFWNKVRVELDNIKPVFMLAEWDTPDLHEKAFEMTYGWDIHRMMNKVYKGEKSASDLKKLVLDDQKKFQDYAYRMQFTSNHDENTWNGSEFERLGDAAEMFAVFTYVIPGMPLIYNGQEAGFNKRLDFFEKDLIDWKESDFTKFYSKLNIIKEENKAIWNGLNGGSIDFIENSKDENGIVILRNNLDNKLLAIFNINSQEKSIKIESEKIVGNYIDFENNKSISITNKLELVLKPWSYKLFFKNN
jgi:glycosidase